MSAYCLGEAASKWLNAKNIGTVGELIGYAQENPDWKKQMLDEGAPMLSAVAELELILRRYSGTCESQGIADDAPLEGRISDGALAIIGSSRPNGQDGPLTVGDLRSVLTSWHKQRKTWKCFALEEVKGIDRKTADELEAFVLLNNIMIGSTSDLRNYLSQRTVDEFLDSCQFPSTEPPSVFHLKGLVFQWEDLYGDWKVGLREISQGRGMTEIEELMENTSIA